VKLITLKSWALIRMLPLYFISFDTAKTIQQSFLSWLLLLLQNYMASHETLSLMLYHSNDPVTSLLNCSVARKLIVVLLWTGPYYLLYPLQNMVIYANQNFPVVYFYSFLFYQYLYRRKRLIPFIVNYLTLLIKL